MRVVAISIGVTVGDSCSRRPLVQMHASKSHCRRSLPPVEVCVRTSSLGCLVVSPCALAAAGTGHTATPFSCQLPDATTSLESPAASQPLLTCYVRSSARRSHTNPMLSLVTVSNHSATFSSWLTTSAGVAHVQHLATQSTTLQAQ